MNTADRAKTINLGPDLLKVIKAEARRTDRTMSWVVRKMCELGLERFRREVPTVDDNGGVR